MPLYDLICMACDWERKDKYFKRAPSPKEMPVCEQCGHRMVVDIRGGAVPLTKTYAEDRPVTDLHIRRDGKPQVITSWEQRRRLMRENGVEEAGVKRGMKGCWA